MRKIGTRLLADVKLPAKKRWIAGHLKVSGSIELDPGAVRVLKADGKSLLPVGIVKIIGEFLRGDVVACVDNRGKEVARGLSNYRSSELERIMGLRTEEVVEELGYLGDEEAIHRDNLVVL